MDLKLKLLKKLQVMKRVEDESSRHYRTKSIDLASFVPMYSNVIIVDQKIDAWKVDKMFIHGECICIPAGPRSTAAGPNGEIQHEFTTNTLTSAMISVIAWSRKLRKRGQYKPGWTIIMKEGLYINVSPFNPFGLINDLIPCLLCLSVFKGVMFKG